jgi:hypothetical protein
MTFPLGWLEQYWLQPRTVETLLGQPKSFVLAWLQGPLPKSLEQELVEQE